MVQPNPGYIPNPVHNLLTHFIGDLPPCPRYPSYDIGEIYANDKVRWVNDFGLVFDKMLLNKVDLSRLVDLN